MSRSTSSSQAKGKPEPLLLSLFTPPRPQLEEKQTDIFSPRPETPSPPQFPFLDSPTPKRHKQVPSPPTPPRPRLRYALSDTTNALPRHKVCGKSSFELALEAFPTPPTRVHSIPLFKTLPASHTIRPPPTSHTVRSHEMKRSSLAEKEKEKEDDDLDSESESDCRTITGIPATPSTANSEWDDFWSEPPSPTEDSARSKHEKLLTEAALIREAYLKLKESEFDGKDERRHKMEVDEEERYH